MERAADEGQLQSANTVPQLVQNEGNTIRTVGRLVAGREGEGIKQLLPDTAPARIGLSGVADRWPALTAALPAVPCVTLASVTGRSIAMGGLAMAALVAMLAPGETGLHLAASPEGPYFSVAFTGAASV